jgi:ABC-type branched-subunit amino acid transport system ATPase component
VTVLIVEHDMSLVMGISDEVVVLDRGSLVAEGTPREVQADPRVVAIYLGEA